MITCPTCGRPVPENQRFCGNCGTDVQAATAFRANQDLATGAATGASASEPYEYDQGGSYYPPPSLPARGMSRTVLLLVVAGVALLCLCCGLVLGGAGVYLLAQPAPLVAPSPTPEGLHLLFRV